MPCTIAFWAFWKDSWRWDNHIQPLYNYHTNLNNKANLFKTGLFGIIFEPLSWQDVSFRGVGFLPRLLVLDRFGLCLHQMEVLLFLQLLLFLVRQSL